MLSALLGRGIPPHHQYSNMGSLATLLTVHYTCTCMFSKLLVTCMLHACYIILNMQTKNASHFAAWSSCLVSHEMYRKTQVASGKSGTFGEGFASSRVHDQQMGGVGVSVTENSSKEFDKWVGKTRGTISDLKKGSLCLFICLSLSVCSFVVLCLFCCVFVFVVLFLHSVCLFCCLFIHSYSFILCVCCVMFLCLLCCSFFCFVVFVVLFVYSFISLFYCVCCVVFIV